MPMKLAEIVLPPAATRTMPLPKRLIASPLIVLDPAEMFSPLAGEAFVPFSSMSGVPA